ncbi:MAG: PAS domain-containing protein [Cyclobacteriaceae bacterium]
MPISPTDSSDKRYTPTALEILAVVDREFRIQSASPAFYQFDEETQKHQQGKEANRVLEGKWDFQQLKVTYEEVKHQANYTEGAGMILGAIEVQGKSWHVMVHELLIADMPPDLLLLIIQEKKEEAATGKLMFDKPEVFDIQVILDDQLRVVSANQRYYDFFRSSDLNTEGPPHLDAQQWGIPALNELLHKVVANKQPFQGFEVEYDFPGIGLTSLQISTQNLVRLGGEPDLILLAMEDRTEQKEIEKELQQLRSTKDRFEVIFHSTYQFIGLLDRYGRVQEVNQPALNFAGIALAEIMDKPVWETPWFQDEQAARLKKAVRRAAAGELVRFEIEIIGQEDRVITIDLSLKPDFTEKGSVRWIIAEGRDISEKKYIERKWQQSQAEALQSQEMLNSVVNHIGLGVKYMKAVRYPSGTLVDFEFVQLNQQAKELLFSEETSLEEIVGGRLLHLLPEMSQVNFQNYKQVLETGTTLELETQYERTYGQQWFHRIVVKLGDGVVVTFEDITRRKQAEIALRRSKQLIDSVYETSSAAIDALVAQRDAQGSITDFIYQRANQKSLEIKQQPDFDFIGKSLLTLYPGVKKEGLFKKYIAVVETGDTFHDVIYYGHEHFQSWFDLTVSKWEDGIVMTLVDITEQKLAEEKVKDSVQQWRTLVNNIPDVVSRHDLNLRYLYISPSVEQMTGLPPEDFIGKTDLELGFPKESAIHYQQCLQQVLATGEEVSTLRRVESHDGERYISTKMVLEYDHQAKPVSILSMARDITELKKSEQKIKDNEHFLLVTQEIAEIGSFAYLEADQSIEGSPKLFDILGVSPQEQTTFSSYLEKLHPYDRERVTSAIEQSMRTGEDYRDEYRILAGPAEKHLLTIGKVEIDEYGAGKMLGVVMDITGLRIAERELRERSQALEVINQELSAFTYSVSHDLRTPLRAASGFTNLLLEKYHNQLDEEGHRLLNTIKYNVSRMGKLIDDLLRFSHLGKKQMTLQPLELKALFEELFLELSPAYGGVARLVVHALPSIKGDRSMMRQAIENLLVNALKFSSAETEPLIEVGLYSDGAQPVIFVRDNGVGFNQQYHDKLFEVFQRLHREDEFKGTGVGLAIVQKIIQRHGGEIWAEGVPGQGATFFFSLSQR